MKTYVVTFSASLASALVLIACLLTISSICNSVNDLWTELDYEVSLLRANTDDIWKDMLQVAATRRRSRRQALEVVPAEESANELAGYELPDDKRTDFAGEAPGHTPHGAPPGSIPPEASQLTQERGKCNCKAYNRCPSGPPGPAGKPGERGPDGKPGLNGNPGRDARDVEPQKQRSGCFFCPQGPQGPPGAIGRPGHRGMAGAKGPSGMPGRNGNPGSTGDHGPPGAPGLDGVPGNPGDKGLDVEHVVGRRGSKGKQGYLGRQGPPGDRGLTGAPGGYGPRGQRGLPGPQGWPGTSGRPGDFGPPGRPGRDAEYCPCPARHVGESLKHLLSIKA